MKFVINNIIFVNIKYYQFIITLKYNHYKYTTTHIYMNYHVLS